MPIATRCDDTSVEARLHGRVGMIEFYQGAYQESYNALLKALDCYEQSNFYRGRTSWMESWLCRWIGRTLTALNEPDIGFQYLQRAINIADEV